MKCKFSQIQAPLYHRIHVKTKLKVKKETLFGITYWKGTKADEIESSVSGKIYKRDGNTGCNCKIEQDVSNSKIRHNNKKSILRYSIGERYRSKINSIISTHRIKIGSHTETKNLQLGDDCDPFRWWTDWY